MQLISKYNKGIRYLLCAIDLFSKYAFVVPLKDRKGTTITNAFKRISNGSKRIKYGLVKAVNFTTNLLKNCYKTMTELCAQHMMKECQSLLKDLLAL